MIKISVNKGFFNKSATKVFLNKTKTVLDINEMLCFCKITFDAIMNENRFLLHGHHGHAYRSPDAEPNFWRFLSIQVGIQKFQDFIKKTKNWFSFANILLVALEIVPFALNTTICTIKKIIEWLF